jgi:hypothetical protein
MHAYLQFGGVGTLDPNGPFLTLTVPCRETALPRHGQPALGYGHAIPTQYLVSWAGRWRRVYACQYGNAATLFIGSTRKRDAWLAKFGGLV